MMYGKPVHLGKMYHMIRNGTAVLQEATAHQFKDLLEREGIQFRVERKVEGIVHFYKE